MGSGTPAAGLTTTSKIDLLLVVDNSISMADKQELLNAAVPDVVGRVTSLGADVHVGVISTSLASPSTVCRGAEEYDDNAHLIGTRPRAAALGLTDGFVSWQPGDDAQALEDAVQGLISVVGEHGCGFETTHEAWYRFLVDPTPPAGYAEVPCSSTNTSSCAVPVFEDADGTRRCVDG